MLTECPNNVSVSSLPAEPGPAANKRRRLEDTEDIEPLKEFPQLTTTTSEHGETFIIVRFSQSVSV